MLEVAQTGFGDLVDAHTTVCRRRNGPLGLDELRFQQPLQGWIQRTFFNLKQIVRALLDVLDESISVRRLAAERFEDHHLERAGE